MKIEGDEFSVFFALVDPFLQFSPRPPGEETPNVGKSLQTRQEIVEHIERLRSRPLWVVELVRSWLMQLPPDGTKRETLLRWYFRLGPEVRKHSGYSDVSIVASLGVFACYQSCLTEQEESMIQEWRAQMSELGEFLRWVRSNSELQQALPIEKKKSEHDARSGVASKGGRTRAANFNAKLQNARVVTRRLLAKQVPVTSRKVYGKWATLEDLFAAVLTELADPDAPALSSLLHHLGPEFKVTRTGQNSRPRST